MIQGGRGKRWRFSTPSGNAGGRELHVLRAAALQSCDEAALARTERAAREARHVQTALDLRLPLEPEAHELTALDLLGDCIAREEGDAESLTRGTLDRLAGIELPHSFRTRAQLSER